MSTSRRGRKKERSSRAELLDAQNIRRPSPGPPVIVIGDSHDRFRGGKGPKKLEERLASVFAKSEGNGTPSTVLGAQGCSKPVPNLDRDDSEDMASGDELGFRDYDDYVDVDGAPDAEDSSNNNVSYDVDMDLFESMRLRLYEELPSMNRIEINHYWSDLELDEPAPTTASLMAPLMLPGQELRAGIGLQEKVMEASEGLAFELLRLCSQSNVTNEFASKLLKTLKRASPSDIASLPSDHRGLANAVPLESVGCWLTHICFDCSRRSTYKYVFGQRTRVEFPTCPNHKVMDYNADHYFVTDVAQVLALVLPTIWKCRSEQYLPPHIRELMNGNGMKFEKDVTITISADGVQTFNSSKLSVWAVLACVDGIPYHIQRKSVFLLGVLCARDDGKNYQVNCMLDDILKQIERINKWTFTWKFEDTHVLTRVLVSRVAADTPARALMQGLNAFQAEYGCNYCYQASSGAYFKYLKKMPELRTDQKIRFVYDHDDFDDETVRERLGVKFKSKFARLPFDLVMGFPPDAMHCVYIGVAKLLIQMWLTRPPTTPKGQPRAKLPPYALGSDAVDVLDARLLVICPPERTSRKPQKISKVGMWKAHELSMFLLYYGPVILLDILPEAYYNHYIDLVAGIALLSTHITEARVSQAQIYLDSFCENIRPLYTRKCDRYNVHLLRHLPQFCAKHGILPLFSMYMFENENHRIVNYVNGPGAVGLQILKKSMQRLMINSKNDYFGECRRASACLEWQLEPPTIDSRVRHREILLQTGYFYAVYKPGNGKPRIVSKAYTMLKSRTSYVVMLDNGNVAIVLLYFVVRDTQKIYALVEEIKVVKHYTLGHIWYLHERRGEAVIPVSCFREQMIHMEHEQKHSFALYLNSIEHVAE